MLCTTKKVQVAAFECLNCENTFMCDYCRQKHLKNGRYKNHKVAALQPPVPEEDDLQIKIDDQQCPIHFQKYRLYCFSDEKPLCLKCTEPAEDQESMGNEELHANHFVKSISSVLEQAEKEKEQLKADIAAELDKIASASEYFAGVEDILLN